jgi:uncharacterized protein DUF6221
MSEDLAAFLTARWDEAQEVLITDGDCKCIGNGMPQRPDCMDLLVSDIAAKRKMVALHNQSHECPADIGDPCGWLDAGAACVTLRLLAEPFSDHPDYDQSWSVE